MSVDLERQMTLDLAWTLMVAGTLPMHDYLQLLTEIEVYEWML